jgi:MFS family permease
MEAVVPPPSPPEIHYYGLALVFLCPALGGFLYGYDIGATSFTLAMLRSTRDHEVWWYGFPKLQQGLLISTLALGALIGSHIVLVYLAQSIGRRKEIRIAAALYIVGAMLNVMSGTMLAKTEIKFFGVSLGFMTLICGRLLYGAGVGFIMHGAPTYMAEMSPSHVRGAVVSAKETVIVFGIIVGMMMGDLLSDYPDNWTGTYLSSFYFLHRAVRRTNESISNPVIYVSADLYAFSILGAVPMLLLTFKIPRSKRWLLMKGYRDEAKESMKFVYKGNVEDEFDKMAETINSLCCRRDQVDDTDDDGSISSVLTKADTASVATTSKPNLFDQKYRSVLLIGVGLLVAQQFSGQPSVLAYSRVLFEAAGWKGHASVVTVVIMGFTSTITVALVDRAGRKILLAAGCIFMSLALVALAFGFWGWDDNGDFKLTTLKQQIILWSMFVYIAGYQVGYGPITWTVLSEIYPTEIRGTAMAFSVEVNFLSKFLCQLLFPVIQDFLGWGCTFILFCCIVLASLVFILVMVPETKGLSLEEIQIKLSRGQRSEAGSSETSSGKPLESPLLDPMPQYCGLTPIV